METTTKKSSLISLVSLLFIAILWNLLGYLIKLYFGSSQLIPIFIKLLFIILLQSSFIIFILKSNWYHFEFRTVIGAILNKRNLLLGIMIGLLVIFLPPVIYFLLPEINQNPVDFITSSLSDFTPF